MKPNLLAKNLYPYEVIVDVRTTTKSAKEAYGDWSSNTTFKVLGIQKSSDQNLFNYDDDFYIEKNSKENLLTFSSVNFAPFETAYLLFYTADSGDSFGNATNSRLEGVHLFKSLDLAKMAAQKIFLDYSLKNDAPYKKYNKEKFDSEYDNLFLIDNLSYGKTYRYDYTDYFGGLNELNIYEVNINKNNAKLIMDRTKISESLPNPNKYLLKVKEIDLIYDIKIEKGILNDNIPTIDEKDSNTDKAFKL